MHLTGVCLAAKSPLPVCVCVCVFALPVEEHVCLLDCISLDLQEMDIFSAERLPCEPWDSAGKRPDTDLLFTSYSVRRCGSSLLQERCHLRLKVERNLDR